MNFKCSFCNKPRTEVKKLIQSSYTEDVEVIAQCGHTHRNSFTMRITPLICDECVAKCVETLAREGITIQTNKLEQKVPVPHVPIS